ncbi:MAG: ATP-binding protein [Pseudomonadota bacterium]
MIPILRSVKNFLDHCKVKIYNSYIKIKRNIFNELLAQINDPKISVLVGPRQVGKTFLLRELETAAKKKGRKTRFFDLEIPDNLLSLGATDKQQFDTIISSGDVVFIDELYLLKNISHVFKAIFDSRIKKPKIFASGSSALELHTHLKESMAGRVIFNRIFPLSLAELRQKQGFKDEDILVTGAMPGLVNLASKDEAPKELQTIVATYINRDIKGMVREENVRAFNHMMYLLAEQQGSIVVSANLANEIDMSKPTVEKYLDILSQTYVCHTVPSFARNLGNELKKSRKQFLFDTGIRNSLLKDFSSINKRKDAGFLKESFVALNLIRQLKANMELRFWRTKQGHEVDFIVIKNRVPYPIEVKSAIKRAEVPDGMKKFLDIYEDAPEALVFNDYLSEEIAYQGRHVRFLPWVEAEDIDFMRKAL